MNKITGITIALLSLSVSLNAQAAKITSIDFRQAPGGGELEILSDTALNPTAQENKQDRQIVFEFENTSFIKGVERKLDTSSFNSPVVLISPYQSSGNGKSKIVVQLRESRPFEVESKGNSVRIRFGASAKTPQAAADPVPAAASTPEVPAISTQVKTAQSDSQTAPNSDGNANLDQFFDNQKEQRWVGTPITVQLRDADLHDVFRFIAEASGFNIVIGDDVRGKITLSLVDVPWDQALDLILRTRQLGAERSNNILRVVTLTNLTNEKTAELNAKKASQAASPRITKIFPISYAKLQDMKTTLETFGRTPGTGANDAQATTVITIDDRTNSLIIQDVPDNMERMKKLVELLDIQTPQVLIEAKIIEAIESFGDRIAGGLGFGVGGDANTQWGTAFNGGNPLDPLFPVPAISGASPNTTLLNASPYSTSAGLGASSNKGAAFGFSPRLGAIGISRLNALLQLGEDEENVKVVSSPKIVVLSRDTANITSGTPVKVTTIGTLAGGAVAQGTQILSANLSLNVTPTVNNDGGVLMDVSITRDIPVQDTGVANRSMKTKVVVESGTTLVIGGIYVDEERHQEGGFPLLRKIPIIGHFFGYQNNTKNKSELFIFITPKVLNPKESGITS